MEKHTKDCRREPRIEADLLLMVWGVDTRGDCFLQVARYRVVWVRESGNGQKVKAAVHRIAPDECPWKNLLAEEPADDAPGVSPAAP